MSEYNLGPVGFLDKGAFSDQESYSKWNMVTTDDSTYVYINDSPAIGKAVTDTLYWKCVANGKPAIVAAGKANTAAGKANTATGKANTAAANADIATGEAVKATDDANDAVIRVNEAIDETLYSNSFMGIDFPDDSSTIPTFVGNSNWKTKPWYLSDMARVLLADDLTENEVLNTWGNPINPSDADLTGASGQVMLRIPKIYYREFFDSTGKLTGYRLSPEPLSGYKLHEKFSWGSGRDYIYIGCYEGSLDSNSKLASVSGVDVLTNKILSQFRSYAQSRGSDWHDYDFFTQHLLQMLFYPLMMNLNSQAALPGYTGSSAWDETYKRLTGRSDILTTMNGSVNIDLTDKDSDLAGIVAEGEAIANRFLFIENLFGHVWKDLDGVSFDGRIGYPNTAYVTADPTKFSSIEADILSNYTNLNISIPAASDYGYIKSMQGLLIPKEMGGDSATYFSDYFYPYLDNKSYNYLRLVRSGGSLSIGASAGVAARSSIYGLGHANALLGSRLCAEKF